MSQPRKLHQIKGTITHCFLGQVSTKGQWKVQPFYYLEIKVENLFSEPTKAVLYAFPNLVSKALWTALETNAYLHKTYLFTYEKRTRGWRLKNWAELTNI